MSEPTTVEIEVEEFKANIDKAGELDKEIKDKEEQLKSLKLQIKEYASKNGHTEFSGKTYKYKLTPIQESEIDPNGFFNMLRNMKRGREFFNYIKVQVTKANDAFGKVTLASITSKVPGTPRITFTKLK